MVKPIDDPLSWSSLLAKANAAVVGPGSGVDDLTKGVALESLKKAIPTVLDADALSCFVDDVQTLAGVVVDGCVLTPHEGEFARLFGSDGHREERALSAARSSRCVVLLKGHRTVIASPGGRVLVNDNAPPSLATAGAGDVLAGLIAALMARGMSAFDAAAAGAWVHGAAANRAAPGLIADDLPELIALVLADFAG